MDAKTLANIFGEFPLGGAERLSANSITSDSKEVHFSANEMNYIYALLCALLFVACAPPMYSITTANPQDRVTFHLQDQTAVFEIHSPGGIGTAKVSRTNGAMPKEIVFRAYLKGLEHFVFAFGQERIEISIPSSGAPEPIIASQPAGSTEFVPLSTNSPLWMPTKIMPPGQSIPLQDGCFEINAPRAFLNGDNREFSIEWIDFYR